MSGRPELEETADRLHSVAIHLLRRLRKVDRATGLSGPRLSALSVVVFAGPQTLGDLAAAEQVKAPTMTRLVQGLEKEGLVRRSADARDGRIGIVTATARGRRVMMEGRASRVKMLAGLLEGLSTADQMVVRQAVTSLEEIVRGASS